RPGRVTAWAWVSPGGGLQRASVWWASQVLTLIVLKDRRAVGATAYALSDDPQLRCYLGWCPAGHARVVQQRLHVCVYPFGFLAGAVFAVALFQTVLTEHHMDIGSDTMLFQAGPGALHAAAINGQDRALGVGLVDQ